MNLVQLKKALDALDWTLKDVAFISRRPMKEVEIYVAKGEIPRDVIEVVLEELKRRSLPYREYINPGQRAKGPQ